jgi:fatty acid desaturase
MRNPIDFTHKSVYDQMDEEARQDRQRRLAYRIAFPLAWLAGFFGMLYFLKHL